MTPDLTGTGWEYVTEPQSPSKLPSRGGGAAAWGPKGDEGKKVHGDLSDMFITFVTPQLLQDVAAWTNYYAAEEPVKALRKTKNNRVAFAPCELGSDGQRYRCGVDQGKWAKINEWHVLQVFGVLLRAGTRRLRAAPPFLFNLPGAHYTTLS